MSTFNPSATDPDRPLLVDAQSVATLLGRSERSICRDDEQGRLPRPIMLGGSKRWRLSELKQWVGAGCPARNVWEARPDRGEASSEAH